MTAPLAGLRCLDMTHMLSGPYATLLLADLGMDVVKVEPPQGDPTRRLLADHPEWSTGGVGAYHAALNRNKRSMVVDLKSADGKALFDRLATVADVVIHNFGPGVATRLGVDSRSLEAVNPRLVTCAISGFGQTGPEANDVAFDMIAQAMSGGMSLTGRPQDPPTRAGVPIGDLGAGMAAAVGILAALLGRQNTSRGRHVDIAMTDVQTSLMTYLGTMAILSRDAIPRHGNAHPAHVPYDAYEASDGWFVVAVVFDKSWPAFCRAVGVEDLDRPEHATGSGRVTHRASIHARLTEHFRARPRDHWLGRLRQGRLPCAPVNTLYEAVSRPQAQARDMRVDLDDAKGRHVSVMGNPVKLSGHRQTWRFAPELDADAADVLQEWLATG